MARFGNVTNVTMTGNNPNAGDSAAPSQMRSHAWRLVGWWAVVGLALFAFRRVAAWQDYKNSGIHVALIAAVLGTAFWTLRNSGGTLRRRAVFAALICTPLWAISPLGPIALVNNGNVGIASWRWRWAPKPDEMLSGVRAAGDAIVWKTTAHDVPAFLGGEAWAEVRGVELDADWNARPPKKLWRQPIGAGWSGFAVVGDYALTQEQRGATELVVCYEVKTGRVAWAHQDEVRWDPGGSGALGGVGPRATPTVAEGRVFTHGATGILNCLDATTGRVIWSHDSLAEEGAENLTWGKAGSPIVMGEWIVVSVGGTAENSLVAYEQATGKKAWSGSSRRSSYATPVLTEIGGMRQIVVVNEDFVTSHDAADGSVLWEHPWPGNSGSNASNSQPVPIGDNRLLLTKGYSVPAEVIEVTSANNGEWKVETVWKKPVLRTKMSNVLIRNGFAFAIDDIDLACVNLETGRRKWKSRRRPEIGNGQIVLVGKHVLALSEGGEVVLVEATPKAYHELGSFQAIEGVTWNNPAISGKYLLVRNAEEAACYELPLKGESPLRRSDDETDRDKPTRSASAGGSVAD